MTGVDDPLFAAVRSTARFVWDNVVSVVGISLCWFAAALPIVTVGPATVGAYAAVLSLRDDETDGVDRAAVGSAVRSQFVHATALGLLPLTLVGVAAAYARAYLATGRALSGVLAVVALYAATYVCLVSVPTFIRLAAGDSLPVAVRTGYLWTARHAVGTVVLGAVTGALFVVSSLLTVAVALLFAGVAFAFHVEFVGGTDGTVLQPARSNP